MRIGVGLLDMGQPLWLFALLASPCESDEKDKYECPFVTFVFLCRPPPTSRSRNGNGQCEWVKENGLLVLVGSGGFAAAAD